MLKEKWDYVNNICDYAYQPIINIRTNKVYGMESLLRGWEECFDSIEALFDEVYDEGLLAIFESELRKKAIKKFRSLKKDDECKLFYNFDIRSIINNKVFSANNSMIEKKNFYYELTSLNKNVPENKAIDFFNKKRKTGNGIVFDKLNTYNKINHYKPDFLKIDTTQLKVIYNNISDFKDFYKSSGIDIIAKNIETGEQIQICKDMGIDFFQGFYIEEPKL